MNKLCIKAVVNNNEKLNRNFSRISSVIYFYVSLNISMSWTVLFVSVFLMATCAPYAVHLWSRLTRAPLWLSIRLTTNRVASQIFISSDCGNYLTLSSFSVYCRHVCVFVGGCVRVCGQCCLSWWGRSLLPLAQWLMKINVWFTGYLIKDLMLKHAPSCHTHSKKNCLIASNCSFCFHSGLQRGGIFRWFFMCMHVIRQLCLPNRSFVHLHKICVHAVSRVV